MIRVRYIVEYLLKPVPSHEVIQMKRCTFKNIHMFVGPKTSAIGSIYRRYQNP